MCTPQYVNNEGWIVSNCRKKERAVSGREREAGGGGGGVTCVFTIIDQPSYRQS